MISPMSGPRRQIQIVASSDRLFGTQIRVITYLTQRGYCVKYIVTLLFDTEVLYQEAIQLAAAEGGHEVAIDVFNRTVGLPWAESRALLLSHFGEAFPVDEFEETWVRHFWAIAETRLELKLGALELLDTLDQFRLPRAITTSSSRRTVERHLTAHNLMGRFAEIVGHGDYEKGKPAPDPFLKAAERLGVEPHLLMSGA